MNHLNSLVTFFLLLAFTAPCWSEDVATLLKPTKFDIVINGAKAGEITAATGTKVTVLKEDQDKALVALNTSSNWIQKSDLEMQQNTPRSNISSETSSATAQPESTQKNQPSTTINGHSDWPFSFGNTSKIDPSLMKSIPHNAGELMKVFLTQYSNSVPSLSDEYNSTKLQFNWGANKAGKINTIGFSSEKIPIDKYTETKKAWDVLIDLCTSKFGLPSKQAEFPTEYINNIISNRAVSNNDLINTSNNKPVIWNTNNIIIRLKAVIYNGSLPYHTNHELLCYVGVEACDSSFFDKPYSGTTNIPTTPMPPNSETSLPSNNSQNSKIERIYSEEIQIPAGGCWWRLEKISPEWENYLKENRKFKGAREILEMHGVTFPLGTSATYLASSSKLLFKNTQENNNKIKQLISDAINGFPVTYAPVPDTPSPTPTPSLNQFPELQPPSGLLIEKAWILPLQFSRTFGKRSAQQALENNGVEFPIGANANFDVSKNLLSVKLTQPDINLVDALIKQGTLE